MAITPQLVNLNQAFGAKFQMPIYQRRYVWEERQWKELWTDLQYTWQKSGESPPYQHFFGTICYIGNPALLGAVPSHYVVDGQQRLTTVTLFLKALHDTISEDIPDLAKTIKTYYRHEGALRMSLGELDIEAYERVMSDPPEAPGDNRAFSQAYIKFKEWISRGIDESPGDKNAIISGWLTALMMRFELVSIQLSSDRHCYEVFQSLNDKGTPLDECDKIRNLIFLYISQAPHLNTDDQRRTFVQQVYTSTWRELEGKIEVTQNALGPKGDLTDFMLRWGILAAGAQFGRNKTADELQGLLLRRADAIETGGADNNAIKASAAEAFAKEMSSYGDSYVRLRLSGRIPAQSARVINKFDRIRRLGVGDASDPMVLQLLKLWSSATGDQSDTALIQCLELLERYMVRRHLCKVSPKSDNRMFAGLAHQLYSDQVILEKCPSFIFHHLKAMTAINCWPTDQELLDSSQTARIGYQGKAKTREILRVLEARAGDGIKPGQRYTIEHILPQGDLPVWWQDHLGPDWQQTHTRLKNTIGNLVLLTPEENEACSNHDFQTKKVVYAGSCLTLVRELSGIAMWRETEIADRGEFLADLAIKEWPREMS